MTSTARSDRDALALAVEQARIGWSEGGIPIGAALVHQGDVRGRPKPTGLGRQRDPSR